MQTTVKIKDSVYDQMSGISPPKKIEHFDSFKANAVDLN